MVVDRTLPLTLGEIYYRLRPVERDGRLYRWLGVPLYQGLVRRGPLSIFNRSIPLTGGRVGLDRLIRAPRVAETAHAIIFILVALVTIDALVRGWLAAAGWPLLFNMLHNGYPVLLQRYHRIRLERVRARSQAKG